MKYLLDANVLIEAKNRHYGFEICPGFWTWIEKTHAAGAIHSVARVGEELRAGDDRLAEWAKEQPELFVAAEEPTVAALREVAAWAEQSGYRPAAISQFLAGADAELVAYSIAKQLTVVTHEIASDDVKRIKIPNACKQFGVAYCDPFAMLDTEGARFVLDH